ncbi:restriction endonuclease subunit S [Leptothrix discophora]|uniref:Restriction endonuclease subunit S n=1 Tax=Leptothrix discophora TaxID=89 RepID=A0ABT9G9R6_LEPDI|nr:restriction endonuclease subunit S [Leptothrix discophora]
MALPPDWCFSTLEEVSRSVGGGTPSKSDPTFWVNGTVPWVSPKDMKTFSVTSSEDALTVKALDRLTLIPAESLLVVVRSGILSRTLPVAINKVPVTINQDMRAFVPGAGILSKYLAWQLMAKEREILSNCSKDGTTVASIEGPSLARFSLSIAPAAEQARIVAKLDELLSDLDAGVAELKAAQKKLAQYRQSLLKAAVDGALTAEWRAQHPPTETGAQLLARILTERRARWEAKQLAKFKEQGKVPPKEWRKKYTEPVRPDNTDLPELPQGWVWAIAEQLCEFITKGTTPPKELDDGRLAEVPFLRVTNLTDTGELNFSDRVYVAGETHRGFLARSMVYPGDVLMNIVGPPLGQVSLVPNDYPEWNINQAIAIFRAVPGLSISFLRSWLLSPTAVQWLKARAKTTAGQANLTLELCRSLPIPLPPSNEQIEITNLIDIVLRAASDQVDVVEKSLKQSSAQRQNILRAAFVGQLVPQDPNDEPASVLLERIRVQRAGQGAASSGRRRRAEKP